jgi:hypothetical protein
MGGSRSWQRRAIHLLQRYWMQILQEASLLSRLGGSSRRLGLFDAGTRSLCPLFSGWNAKEGINAIPRRSERCVQNSLYARFLLCNRMNISGTSTASFDARFSGINCLPTCLLMLFLDARLRKKLASTSNSTFYSRELVYKPASTSTSTF